MPLNRQTAFLLPNGYTALVWILAVTRISIASGISGLSSSLSSSLLSTATCPARTVNYITHTLPLQCFKTSWASPNASSSTSEEGASPSNASSIDASSTAGSSGSASQSQDGTGPHSILLQTQSLPTGEMTVDIVAFSFTPSISSNNAPDIPAGRHVSTTPTSTEPDIDVESPLENAKFLSFEDWKRQNLAKAGQSADNIGSTRQGVGGNEPRKRPGDINNALDALGDDGEIKIEFGGFGAEKPETAESISRGRKIQDEDKSKSTQDDSTPKVQSRSKDAGTTCKERFNYASFDCAATVLKTNPQCSGSSSVLVENKDSYMLNECSANDKFLILELCDDILIDTVVLANFEFFSSIFRTFRVSVSDRYPVKLDKWRELGTYEARNTREVQVFLVENPLIWARYLRIEFLTHYGNEFYCPVSLVRVHGTTMLEEFKHDGESARSEEEGSEDVAEAVRNGEMMAPEAVADSIIEERKAEDQRERPDEDAEAQNAILTPDVSHNGSMTSDEVATRPIEATKLCPFDKFAFEQQLSAGLFHPRDEVCPAEEADPLIQDDDNSNSTAVYQGTVTKTVSISLEDISDSKASTTSATPAASQQVPSNQNQESISTKSKSSSLLTQNTTPMGKPDLTTLETLTSRSKVSNGTSSETTKSTSAPSQPHPPSPTTQESFFKSVHKRLQMLEANSSLSLLYIEEQSRNLRDAFNKVEKRQLAKTTTFLENLNITVLSELREFRQQYDQIWQSTVIELENQREQYQQEVLPITSRLSILADEVVFQKRIAMIQTMLVLLCLGLVLFSRGTVSNYLELPLLQSMMSRSASFPSPSPTFDTPSGSPSSTRPNSSGKEKTAFGVLGGHRRNISEDSRDELISPKIAYSPPTPTSDLGHSDRDNADSKSRGSSPTPSFDATDRPSSSPPMLNNGMRKAMTDPPSWQENDALLPTLLRPGDATGSPPRMASFDGPRPPNG